MMCVHTVPGAEYGDPARAIWADNSRPTPGQGTTNETQQGSTTEILGGGATVRDTDTDMDPHVGIAKASHDTADHDVGQEGQEGQGLGAGEKEGVRREGEGGRDGSGEGDEGAAAMLAAVERA